MSHHGGTPALLKATAVADANAIKEAGRLLMCPKWRNTLAAASRQHVSLLMAGVINIIIMR